MKIVICGSMSASNDMLKISKELSQQGHTTILPRNTKNYANGNYKYEDRHESFKNKIENDLIRDYFKEIKNSDAVLIVNSRKGDIDNYCGGNSLIELAFGYALEKKLYLVNPIPDLTYADEIKAMEPIILNGDLSKIK
jgi:predicted RNA-binding protein with PUA domain